MQIQPLLNLLCFHGNWNILGSSGESENCWLNSLDYACCLILPLQSLCRGPGHWASELLFNSCCWKQWESPVPVYSHCYWSSSHLLPVLSPPRYTPFLSWHDAVLGHPDGPWQLPHVLTVSTGFLALTHSAIQWETPKSPVRRRKENLAVRDVGGRRQWWTKWSWTWFLQMSYLANSHSSCAPHPLFSLLSPLSPTKQTLEGTLEPEGYAERQNWFLTELRETGPGLDAW